MIDRYAYIYKYSFIDKSSLSTAPARKHTTSSSSTVPRSQATSSTDVSVIFASELIQILSKHCAVIQQQKIGTYSMMMMMMMMMMIDEEVDDDGSDDGDDDNSDDNDDGDDNDDDEDYDEDDI